MAISPAPNPIALPTASAVMDVCFVVNIVGPVPIVSVVLTWLPIKVPTPPPIRGARIAMLLRLQ